MRKLKKVRFKLQEAKRRVQFAMHMKPYSNHAYGTQTVIPEVERYRFEMLPDDEDFLEGNYSQLS